MFKLAPISKKNQAAFSTTDKPMEYELSAAKKKVRFSLLFIWLIAAAVCGLVFTLNRVSENSDSVLSYLFITNSGDERLFQNKSNLQTQNANPTNAFVFVNINRKYVITSYPSNKQTEANFTSKNDSQKNRPGITGSSTTKVIRKRNPTLKKQVDFSIKPHQQ